MVNLTELAGSVGLSHQAVSAFVSESMADHDSLLYAAVNAALRASMDKVNARATNDKFAKRNERVIPYKLNDTESALLSRMFNEFIIDVRPSELVNSRMMRALSYMAREAVYSSISECMDVIEFTGELIAPVLQGRKRTHVCFPMVNTGAYNDFLQQLARLRAMLETLKLDDDRRKLVVDFYDNKRSRLCDRPCDCAATGDVAIFDHIMLSVPLEQVATVMKARRISEAYGYFLYSRDIEYHDSGAVGDTTIRYHVARDSRGRRSTITFFCAELGVNVTHDYSSYMKMLSSTVLKLGDRGLFNIETYDQRHGVLYFYVITDVSMGGDLKAGERFIWDAEAADSYVIRSYRLRTRRQQGLIHGVPSNIDPADYRSYEPFTFFAPRATVVLGLRFAFTLEQGKMTRTAIFDRINDYNSRSVIHGADVQKPPKTLNPEELLHLSYVLYAVAFEARYDEHMVEDFLKNELRGATALAQMSVTGLFFKAAYVSVLSGLSYISDWVTNKMRDEIMTSHLIQGLHPSLAACQRYASYSGVIAVSTKNYKSVVSLFNPAYGKELVLKSILYPKHFLAGLVQAVDQWLGSKLVTNDEADHIVTSAAGSSVVSDEPPDEGIALEDLRLSQAVMFKSDADDRPAVFTGDASDSYGFLPYVPHYEDVQKAIPRATLGDMARELSRQVIGQTDACPISTAVLEVTKTVGSVQNYDVILPPVVVENAVEVLQESYDDIMPGASVGDRYFDSANVNDGDLALNISTVKTRITASKIMPIKAQKAFQPKLRTAASAKRPKAVKETIVGLKKRNFNTPALEEPTMFIDSMNKAYAKFFTKFCKRGYKRVLKYYQDRPICISEESIELWTSRLDSEEKIQRLRKLNFSVDKQAIDRYNLMIRSNVKAKAERGGHKEYQAIQTVVYHDSSVNGYYSPLMMEIFTRLEALLKPNVGVNIRKNRENIEEFLNTYHPRNAKVWYMENDFSKYDKSQQWRALYTEWGLYELLGLHIVDLDRWCRGHRIRTVVSPELGLLIIALLQRCSGDATTTLGNTVVNMISVADVYEIDRFYLAFFIGDDSVLVLRQPIQDASITSTMGGRYNLVAKAYCTQQGYFCSSYIVPTLDGIKFMRDPVKVVEKLAQSDTADEEILREKWVSLNDTMKNYSNENNLVALNRIVCLRNGYDSVISMLHGLYTVLSSYTVFRSLYGSVPFLRAF